MGNRSAIWLILRYVQAKFGDDPYHIFFMAVRWGTLAIKPMRKHKNFHKKVEKTNINDNFQERK